MESTELACRFDHACAYAASQGMTENQLAWLLAQDADALHSTTPGCFGISNDPAWPEWGSDRRSNRMAQWQGHSGEVLDEVTGLDGQAYTVIRCQPCILTHVVPLPDEDTLATYYQERFYQVSKADMVARYARDRPWWEFTHRVIIAQMLEAAKPLNRYTGRLSFVDIGAGPGIALDVAQAAGCLTVGIEPHGVLAHELSQRGHRMFAGMWQHFMEENLSAYWQALWPVDLIYLYETLEHLPNPEEALLWAYDHMTPGGILGIQVPNDYNPLQLYAQEQHGLSRWWLAPPEHLHYFTPKTLQLLVRRCGFALIDIRGTYPMELFLLRGKVYVGDDAMGRRCHQYRMQEELEAVENGAWPILEDLYRRDLAKHRKGREIVLIARKR